MNNELANGMVAIDKDEKVVTSSLVVAETFGREHSDVKRGIEGLMVRHSELRNEFSLVNIPDSYGRKRMGYSMTQKGFEALEARYKYRARSASLERAFGEWLYGLFDENEVEEQVRVLNYRIDFVIGGFLYIEYDEKEHAYKKERDDEKERAVMAYLFQEIIKEQPGLATTDPEDHIRFIRVAEGEEIDGIRRILHAIEEVTWGSPVRFLKQEK